MREVAIVTGASSGIGAAFARLLAPDFDLVLVARRRERLEALARELSGEGRAHRVVDLDLSRSDAAEALAAEVPACDRLINNAGFGIREDLAATDAGALARMLDLNVRTLTLLTRRYLPGMIDRKRGGILNVSSVGGFLPTPRMAAYSASKAYVLSFTQAVREEVRGAGVQVTALCPGITETDFQAVAGIDVDREFGPMKRFLYAKTVEEVAQAGLAGLRKNEAIVIPGATNVATRFLSRVVPEPAMTWVAGRVLRGR